MTISFFLSCMCTVSIAVQSLLTLLHSAFASYIITAVTWISANPRYFTLPGSFTCAFTTIMGCRLILNLCRVYYQPTTVPPQSIWAASEAIRFKPSASAAETPTYENWAVESEASPRSKSPGEDGYELYDLPPLERTKNEE